MPSWANAVLQETVSASISDWSAPPLQVLPPKLRSVRVDWGRSSSFGASSMLSGV
jgi:hypothetical protein